MGFDRAGEGERAHLPSPAADAALPQHVKRERGGHPFADYRDVQPLAGAGRVREGEAGAVRTDVLEVAAGGDGREEVHRPGERLPLASPPVAEGIGGEVPVARPEHLVAQERRVQEARAPARSEAGEERLAGFEVAARRTQPPVDARAGLVALAARGRRGTPRLGAQLPGQRLTRGVRREHVVHPAVPDPGESLGDGHGSGGNGEDREAPACVAEAADRGQDFGSSRHEDAVRRRGGVFGSVERHDIPEPRHGGLREGTTQQQESRERLEHGRECSKSSAGYIPAVRVALLTRGDLFPTWHGAAVKIVRTAEALVERGDRVFVLTDDRDAYWAVEPSGWRRVAFGARFRALEEWPLLRNGARAERWCARVGYPKDEHFLYRPLFDPAWWARAVYVGVRERIDVYQAEFPGYAAPALVAARTLGGRAVAVMHNVEFDRLRQMAGLPEDALARIRRAEVALLGAVDGVIAVSEADRSRIVDAGVPTERVSVIPHGVDIDRYVGRPVDLRVRYGLGGGPVLFFHGTLHYGPNAEAIRFLADLVAPHLPRGATILIAGMSPPRDLETERVRFTGPVDDLPAHVEAADLCLCPLFAGGGTRMKILEYFAAGKAVVSTALGAEGLDIVDGEHLVLAERGEFLASTLAMLNDPERRRRIGRAARGYARARDWRTVTADYARVHGGERLTFSPRPSIEAHLPPREPSKPLTLLLLVNKGCNLRCSFCDLWEGKELVPVDKAVRLFDEARAIGTRTVVLTGGEPLLHPGLFTMVRAAKDRGMGVNVTTNGTLVERHYAALLASGVDSLSFSIDGLPETHDRLRGQKGAHRRTWHALLKTLHDRKIGANVYFVVTNQNVRELVAVWEEVRRAGAGFDFWPVNDAPDLYLTSDEDKAAWHDAVAHIARHDATVAARAHYYAEGLGYHAGENGPVRCLGLVDQYGVTYTGDLLPCCVWGGDGLRVGNVFERPLTELWYAPEVQAHREHLYKAGCTAGCYNHSLYEFVVSTGKTHRAGRE